MTQDTRRVWARRLKDAARSTLGERPQPPDPPSFVDEFGHHRPTDAAFFRWILGGDRAWPVRGLTAPGATGPARGATALACACWDALTLATVPAPILTADSITRLIRPDEHTPLEVAHEAQLCALHAISHIARHDPRLAPMISRSAHDLIRDAQPDNATNHPWAIHVFASLGCTPTDDLAPEADHYAQTLLHNAMVARGRPDTRSAWILLDAARALTPPEVGASRLA